MTQPQAYLLVPMMPTPNGPLHLGHAAGPYLRMDVLARWLRQQGHQVGLITTTDCFETHVLQSAAAMGLSTQETCAHFHGAIQRDFSTLDIAFDAFINPTAPNHAPAFQAVHARVTDRLLARGAARVHEEKFLADEASGEPLLGFRLTGQCARCAAETVGFVCENCGLQMTTDMLRNPRPVSGGRAVWRTGATLALNVQAPHDVALQIAGTGLPAEFQQAMTGFLDAQNLIRITTLGDHGVGRHTAGGQAYTLYNTYFGHALYCGEVFREMFSRAANPFEDGSGVTTVTSCGLDNATDLTASLAFARAYGGHHSFDHCLGNFFLTLRGRKFSTGARHAIFVADLARRATVSIDALRFHLACISPHDQMRDFATDDFVALHNGWFAGELLPRIHAAGQALAGTTPGAAGPPSPALEQAVRLALRQRDHALAFDAFSPPAYAEAVRAYAAFAPAGAGDAYFWLKGFAVLAYPLMPALCTRIWAALGGLGMPAGADMFEPARTPCKALALEPVQRISAQDLDGPGGLD